MSSSIAEGIKTGQLLVTNWEKSGSVEFERVVTRTLPIVPFKTDWKMIRDIRRKCPHTVHIKFMDQRR